MQPFSFALRAVAPTIFAAFLSLPLMSQTNGGESEFFVGLEGGRVDTRLGFDPGDEKMFDSLRDSKTDEEVNQLKNEKATLFNNIFEFMRDERWEDALYELKKYTDCVRQIYGPGDYAYREVVAESLSLFAKAFVGKQNYIDAIRCYQQILQKYKDTPVGPKSAFEWSKIFAQLFTGEIPEIRGLSKPDKAVLLKRILYVKVLKPKDELVSDAYLLAADVLIADKDFVEARKFLDLIDKEFPRSVAADYISDRRKKME